MLLSNNIVGISDLNNLMSGIYTHLPILIFGSEISGYNRITYNNFYISIGTSYYLLILLLL